MEKDKIFFAESGLTSTSANYIANLAKESYRQVEQYLENVVFYTTTVKLLGSSSESLLNEGVSTVDDICDKLHYIASLKSLIAWIREALKAKTRLIEEAEDSSYEDFGIERPVSPTRESTITEDDVISSWNIKQRNRYYYLETLCAVLGEYIHPDGTLANEREQLHKILSKPRTVDGKGRDAILYTRMPSVDPEKVEDAFMNLQDTYRSYQAELNSIKHEIKSAVDKDNVEKNLRFNEAAKAYKAFMLNA